MSAKPSTTDPAAERVIGNAQLVTDRAFLEDVIAGRMNLLNPRLCDDYLMPIYSRIAPGSEMEKLFERAAFAYSDAATAAAYRCMARMVCEAARDGTLRELREDFEADDRDDDDE
ncbi:hypothetical protein WKW77_12215 [Variovorax ureilyticus]|uniref:Uncharacterized protein n=1 Tax=Variovorax ureilyticus TaxID=1836198 RepID=A0ABU8VE02_9BURK